MEGNLEHINGMKYKIIPTIIQNFQNLKYFGYNFQIEIDLPILKRKSLLQIVVL